MKLRVGRKLARWVPLLNNYQRRFGTTDSTGYTLLEVMLFMAISAVFFAITVVVMQGQGARTEFVASMNDVNSKMQQWIDQVRNGYTSSSAGSVAAVGNYNCSLDVSTNNPKLSFPGVGNGNAVGTNLSCIFLGRAIMVNDETGSGPTDLNNKMYAYTVLGRRTYDSGTGQENVNNLLNANPTAAVFDGNGDGSPSDDPTDINLTEVYKIPNGMRVKHVWSSATPGQTNTLAGFFIDPTSANNSLLAVQYPLVGNIDPTAWGTNAWDIPKCINLNLTPDCPRAGTLSNLWPMTQWNICFESTRDDEMAWLKVISSSGSGAVTKLEMGKTGLCA
jgi:type II secretory pathway pseudopilin PulG